MGVVVRDKGRILSGEFRDLWHDVFSLVLLFRREYCSLFRNYNICVGLRETFLLVVGMRFLLPLLWLV